MNYKKAFMNNKNLLEVKYMIINNFNVNFIFLILYLY